MSTKNLVAPWVRRFLLEHLVADLNLSRNTQASYRDALTLLLPFAAKQRGRAIRSSSRLNSSRQMSSVASSHTWKTIGTARCPHVTSGSRAQIRLRSVHREPKSRALGGCAELTAIPFKKAAKGTLPYLEKPEMNALLGAPDRRTCQGARDHALLLFFLQATRALALTKRHV